MPKFEISDQEIPVILESSPSGVIACDTQWHLVYCNSSARHLLGIHGSEVIGKSWWELFPQASGTLIEAEYSCAAAGEVRNFEFFFDTSGRLLRFHCFPRQVGGIFATIHDVGSEKLVNGALKESEEKLRLFIEHAPAALAMFDREMRYLYVSKRWLSNFGLKDQDLTGQVHYDVFPDIPDRWKDAHQRGLAGEVIQKEEDCFERADGRIHWVRWVLRPWCTASGEIGGIVIFSEDITERKLAEEELINERNVLQAVMNGAKNSLLVYLDRNFNFVRVNQAYAATCGYTPEEMIGKNHFALFPDAENEAIFKQVRDTGTCFEVHDKPFEFPDQPKRGITWWDWTLSPIKNSAGEVIGLVFSLFETTRRKLLEEQLKLLNSELERRVEERTADLLETQNKYLHAEKLAAIGRLSASMAHEFNNPLQGVLSILSGLKKRAVLEQDDRKLLEAAIGECNRMRDLIRSLQDFNRPSANKKVQIDIHESIDALLLLSKKELSAKRITLRLDFAEHFPRVWGVPDQIKQVFLNLLTNAMDACRESGGKITVSTRQEGDRVAIAIKDSGIGIKPEDMDKIFQPFFTTKPAVKGTGLGLSVSYGIIKNHGGQILVESQPGKGSTFTVVLPVKGGDLVKRQKVPN